jgi:hypothetical protein
MLAVLADTHVGVTGASRWLCPSPRPGVTVTRPGDLSPGVTDTLLDSLSSEEDLTLLEMSTVVISAHWPFMGSRSLDRARLRANLSMVLATLNSVGLSSC